MMQNLVTGTFFFFFLISVDEILLALQNFYIGVKLASPQLRNRNEEFRGIRVMKAEAVTIINTRSYNYSCTSS